MRKRNIKASPVNLSLNEPFRITTGQVSGDTFFRIQENVLSYDTSFNYNIIVAYYTPLESRRRHLSNCGYYTIETCTILTRKHIY